MTKTLVDISDEALAIAQHNLGTTTKRETIERALGVVNAIAAQLAMVDSVIDSAAFAGISAEFAAEIRN